MADLRRALDTVKDMLWWLRQLICIHGPIGHADNMLIRKPGDPYAFDFCKRCMKVTMYYSE